jgi:hypothetical protein
MKTPGTEVLSFSQSPPVLKNSSSLSSDMLG